MQKNALRPKGPDAVSLVLAAIAAVTAYRVVLLSYSTADLFLDEAQYWLWSQELDWGYYSKPPLIGWVIRAVTDLAGSDSAFWVRVPGALLHALTALILMAAARRFADPGSAAMVALTYATLPCVALGSFLFSTDTVLMPFFAGAILFYLLLTERASVLFAAGLGICVGLGMMSKYAAIYFPVCAVLAAILVPKARISVRDAAVAAAFAVLVFSPNIIWNLQNDLTTLSHTADNVDWVRKPGINLNFQGLAEFFASQFAVMGPVFFGAYLWLMVQALRSGAWHQRWLVWISLPILLLVSGQALLSKAFANWAVTAYAGAVLLTVPILWSRARVLFCVALVVNLAMTIALPIAATQTTSWKMGESDRLVLRRYTGRTELADRVVEIAEQQGVKDIVAVNRHVLADLTYALRDADVSVFSAPIEGRAPHYYAQRRKYPDDRVVAFVFVTVDDGQHPCETTEPVAQWTGGPGAYQGNTVRVYRTTSECWRPE